MRDELAAENWIDARLAAEQLPPLQDRLPEWMGPEEFVHESARADDRLVLVPVGRFDRRAGRALTVARGIPARVHRAVHVTDDVAVARTLTDAWHDNQIELPLTFVENEGGVAATIARVVEMEIAAGFDEVLVIAGQYARQGPVDWIGHDGTAARISRAVRPIPAALTGLVAVAAR
jgi:hypothetical protein